MKAILTFAPLFGRVRSALLLTLALSLVTILAGIGLLGLSGWFITAAALSSAGALFNLFAPSAGVRALSFVRIGSRYGERLSGHDATLRLLSDLRVWLFTRLFPLVPFGRRFGRGDLVGRLLADVEALDTMFLVALGPISTAVLAGAVVSAVLAVFLPAAALAYALLFFAAVLLVPIALILSSRRAAGEVVQAMAELRQSVLDGVDGHSDLVLFEARPAAQARTAAAADRLATGRRRLGLTGAVAAAAVQLLAAAALVSSLLFGLSALEAGSIDGPLMAGLLLAVLASFEASAMLVRSATRLAGAAAAAERLQQVATSPPVLAGDPVGPELPAGGAIRFERVRFGYDPARPVLEDLDLSIAQGTCIAIVGPSGAGKSTIAQLLLRLIAPQSGTVRINGCNLAGLGPDALLGRVALMTQDAPVFLDTVRANLLIGREDATDDELWQVLDAVALGAFIRALPGGLDALVGEAGRTLSVGQARRLCLARTLLSRADILVFDEPTSGLDADAEAAFLADLPGLTKGRTAVVITHANVPAAFDDVLTLKAGRIG